MAATELTKADFQSDQETRWCPGCGDYAVLSTVQGLLPELGVPPEKTVFITGIGCAGRFAYYMDTYGMHGIHGRAPALATGLATTRPDLAIWVVSGDGDALSIGGNHLIHALRRNVPLRILLFNNQIYGLTKGQYSPTSERGKVTKSTPMGSVDQPFNPLSVAIGAEATFVARAIDTDKKELTEVLRAAAEHKGSAFVEIYQNCNIYNDGAFDFVREEKENIADRNGVTLSGLLNVLDGFYAPTSVLFMMTTNRIESLDEALLRPGRIDYKLFMGEASARQKIELYRRFFPESSQSEAEAFVEIYASAGTMAEFQGLLLELEQQAGSWQMESSLTVGRKEVARL